MGRASKHEVFKKVSQASFSWNFHPRAYFIEQINYGDFGARVFVNDYF
jgi:hypothetical protein